MDAVKGKNVIITLGDTGSGKSTMLSSLLHGPENLEAKQTSEVTKLKSGKKKEVKKWIIEQKEAIKKSN